MSKLEESPQLSGIRAETGLWVRPDDRSTPDKDEGAEADKEIKSVGTSLQGKGLR